MLICRELRCVGLAAALVCAGAVHAPAAPVQSAWPVDGPDDSAAVAAAALSGWYAVADTYEDIIEVRTIDRVLVRTITKADVQALAPWMTLDGGPDGVHAMAFSDSGRLLFIGVHDSTPAPDAGPNDCILRYDTFTDQLTLFTREDLSDLVSDWPHASMAHFKGRLYVGATGGIRIYRANMNDATATTIGGGSLVAGQMTTGLAIDRETSTLYAAAANGTIARAPLGGATLTFTTVGSRTNVRALAWSDHYGGVGQGGLYVLTGTTTPAAASVWFVPPTQARGTATFSPTLYTAATTNWHDLAATADGGLLVGADEDAVLLTDSTDTRLAFRPMLADEFNQVVTFCKGLISPDGEPAGWVIDADVIPAWSRFHPATPDAAGWVLMVLAMSDALNADASAQTLARTVLRRYAGRAADGIGPSRTSDGIFRHWIDPVTGNAKPGWDPEYATLSTMLLAQGASAAAARWPGDADIQASARAIICGVSNWDAYLRQSDGAMAFKGLVVGGADPSIWAKGFHEGMLFTRQAAQYGGPASVGVATFWNDRIWFPSATLVSGQPVATNSFGVFQPAFITAYCQLTHPAFRASVAWQQHVKNLRASHAAWTDDNGPQFNTVFSAGTSSFAGGYNADSLSGHPGDVTTFPSLLALAAGTAAPNVTDAVGAYQAYRRGARETFKTGASFLWRRSNATRTNNPDSAAVVDVATGALGIAELLQHGIVQATLAGPLFDCASIPCLGDFDGSGGTPDAADVEAFFAAWLIGDASADVDQSGGTPDAGDVDLFFQHWLSGC